MNNNCMQSNKDRGSWGDRNEMGPLRTPRRIAWVIVCLWLVLGANACRWPWQDRPFVGPVDPSPVELKQYEEAVRAYKAEDYADAIRRFEAVREQTGHSTIARMALFGLACSRLMAAETPSAYKEALALWEAWVRTAPCPGVYEDARLFAPMIRHKMIFSHIPLDMGGLETLEAEQTVPKWFMVQADQELRRLKDQLNAAEHHIENKDKNIKALEAEINRLSQQIEALEKIDQQIQQRKSAIPVAE